MMASAHSIALFSILLSACGFISPLNSTCTFSPYNWLVDSTTATATSVNPGAYFRCLFQGSSLNLTFDASRMVSPPSQLYYQVDNGPMTPFLISSTVPVAVPPNLTRGDVPWHALLVVIKSVSGKYNRWLLAGPSARVVFAGLALPPGAGVAPWLPSPLSVLVYGDSITEGQLTLGQRAGAADVDDSDATLCWSYQLGRLLGAEVGVVGFGGTGILKQGGGNVPGLNESYALLWQGTPRAFAPAPSLIVLNEGTNDGNNNISAALAGVLAGLAAAAPGAPIAVMRPFDGSEDAALRAAAAACAACHYVNTTGFYSKAFGGALHPTGPNDVARIAPQVAAALRPLMWSRPISEWVCGGGVKNVHRWVVPASSPETRLPRAARSPDSRSRRLLD